MSRLSAKRTWLAVSAILALFFALPFMSRNQQAWLGVLAAHAGQASNPDLVVSSVSNPPSTAIAGTSFSVTDTTGNTENVTANPSTTRYRLSSDSTITSSDFLLTGTRSVPTLAKKSSSTGTVSVTIPVLQSPGTYYLGACADDLSVITELSETNNCRASTTTVVVAAPATINILSASSGPIGTLVTISGSNFGATQGASTVTFNGVTATPTNWSTNAITVPVPANASTGPVVVTVGGAASNGVNFTLTYSPRINAGGSSYTDGSGNYWAADQAYGSGPWGYVGGSTFSTGDPIANTSDDLLYQSERFGTFGYKFDVPNGKYDVVLHLAEIWFNAAGQRFFKVLIEGSVVLDNYDIFTEVGHDAAVTKTFHGIDVQDGQLNIDFAIISNNAKISAIAISPARPTKLAITSVNTGNTPAAGVGFPVVVQAQNPNGVPTNVTSATNVNLTVKSGAGTLGGTVAGTIPIGENQATINGVTYSQNDFGVVLTASATSGETLTPGDSAPFNVVAGSPAKLAFTFQPGGSTTSGAITGPPTVAVQDSAGNTITSSSATITIAIGNNPGSGALTGTTARNAASGVAAFADLKIDQAGTGYTLTASSAGLTGATSSAFNITPGGSVAGTVLRSGDGGTIAGALVEALQAGVVKGTGSTNSSGNYSITGLLPGVYDIRGTAGGFGSQSQTGLTISAGAAAIANFSLAVFTPTAGIIYVYDELSRLKSVIDPVGEAATYGYDPVGNLLSITRNNSLQTSIIDFNPNSGPIGSTVTIHGTGYSATPSQNTVTFNGVAASVVSSGLTQIVATVPVGATTGAIAVSSPAGNATSATAYTVTNVVAPAITSFTPTIAPIGAAITISGTNFEPVSANNEVHFTPTRATITASTTTEINTTVPVGARSGRISVATPRGTAVSAADFVVLNPAFNPADIEFFGKIIAGGASHTVTITTANKNGVLLFDGTAGQRLGLGVNSSTIPIVNTHVYKPDGTLLTEAPTGTGTNLDMTLPSTGTYTIVINPFQTNIGSVTYTLSEVINAGTIEVGGASVTVTVARVGQQAYLTFDGAAGQQLGVGVSSSTMTGSNTNTHIFKPDGSQLTWDGGNTGTGTNIDMTLPVSGSYKILLNPFSTNTGSITFLLSEVIDAGLIEIGGSSVTVTVPRVGQQAYLTFSGTANQSLRLTVNNNTMSSSNTNTYIFKPDGSQLTWDGYTATGTNLDMTLPVTGPYKVWLNPHATGTGSVTYTLSAN